VGRFDPRSQQNIWTSDKGIGNVDPTTPLALELNAVTRLENDAGNHNLSVHLWLADKSTNGPLTHRICILFDWYGKEATQVTLTDGFRNYEFMDVVLIGNEPAAYQYRIQGFRGAPHKVNLQAFVVDAIKHGLPKNTVIMGLWFGNEVWDGSRGGTLVTQCDLLVDGKRSASLPMTGK
jgi:hypothetical protein